MHFKPLFIIHGRVKAFYRGGGTGPADLAAAGPIITVIPEMEIIIGFSVYTLNSITFIKICFTNESHRNANKIHFIT